MGRQEIKVYLAGMMAIARPVFLFFNKRLLKK